jgi:hypothetical protein
MGILFMDENPNNNTISKAVMEAAIQSMKTHNTQAKTWNNAMASSIDEASSSKLQKG